MPVKRERQIIARPSLREDLSTWYGLLITIITIIIIITITIIIITIIIIIVRFSTDIYGSKREKTVFRKHLQEACFARDISESLRKPVGVFWIM